MPQRSIKRGSTDQSVALFIFNATTGAPRTSMTHTAPGLSLWYRREKKTKVTLTAAALTSLSAAHADGGFKEIGNGSYRLDLPDAAVAASSGVNGVLVGGTATSVTVVPVYVELPAYDPFDGVRLGITALPNAASSAAGGLPVSTAGGLSLDDMDSALSTAGATLSTLGGKVIGTIASGTHNPQSGDAFARIGSTGSALTAIPWNASWDAQVESEVDDALGGGTGTALTSIPWNSAWDAQVESEVTDALNAYNPPTYTEMTAAFTQIKGATFSSTTDTLEAIRNKETDIETDTQDLQTQVGTDGAGLTNIPWNASWDAQVESEVDDALGGGTGTALTSVPWNAAWDAEVQSEVADALNAYDPPTKAEMSTALGALNDLSAAEVNAEVVDALATDTISQPGQESPAAAQTIAKMVAYLYKAWRNLATQTATQYSLYDDAGSTVDQKATVSDNGTTFSKGEVGTGA